jgi:methyl-accepting chemotaxis protein
VARVTDIMGEISMASREQEMGIEQINGAVSEMDTVTQQNAALVEEAAAAAQSLQDQAARLSEVVSVFRLDDGAVKDAPRADRSVRHEARAVRPALAMA